ncbi:V-type ATP synthase subunit A [Acholeplasma granularum]|uniref:V-type ATP synthase subunit A n=1 Tax=Acholeplasma granularum TaxID=264635 RepID=UPI00046F5A38|nr:V-type ATP synthase subunit A [Acholeplasma granularum]
MTKQGIITKVSGPLIVAKNMGSAQVYDVVRVSNKRLIGEVLELRGDLASIQVYEETAGIGPGEPVYLTNEALSVELAPGLIGGIFDGIERPLDEIYKAYGQGIPLGVDIPKLNREKKWDFIPTVKVGDEVVSGDIIGEVQESESVVHKIMVPFGKKGKITAIHEGSFTITETLGEILNDDKIVKLQMLQTWPVRRKRPYTDKIAPTQPMVTGQRVIDTLFPIAIGGIAAIPGPFGSGKTVVQHQLAKWADADIIVYIGCGERGNEMTDVLMEFPELKDPRTGQPLMKRTVLIANTSNMPVAAREASIYTGITIAEYYRDMGYKVAIMADSTSRWAEALREMSSRLEEMPGEEGYPAYLGSRIAEFYERAGLVLTLGAKPRVGAITAIGAVSPPGGDTSEPVSQATLRIVKVFWGLSASLAYKRHFPAIDWLKSYSLYDEQIRDFFNTHVDKNWTNHVSFVSELLQTEASLQEIVRLVGVDSLGASDRLKLLVAQMIREDYLHQNAFDSVDTYTSLDKQFKLLDLIVEFNRLAELSIQDNVSFQAIDNLTIKEQIGRFKYVIEKQALKTYENILNEMNHQFDELRKESNNGY